MPRKKVKDMPRKQQMAVKAAMAEKAAGKKSPTKMVSARDINIAKRENKRKRYNKIQRIGEGIMTLGGSEVARKLIKLSPTIDSKIKKFKKASALKMKKSPALKKLSAGCKAAAKRKFKVYPSAYANMWASAQQRKGKC